MVSGYSIHKRIVVLSTVTLMAQSYSAMARAQQSPQPASPTSSSSPSVPQDATTSTPPNPWLPPNRTSDTTQPSILPPSLLPSVHVHTSTPDVPTPAPAPATQSPQTAAVHFDANLDDVRLLIRRDEGVYARAPQYDYLCAAPCDLHFLPGAKRISISFQGETPIDIRDPVSLPDNSVLRATYSSRALTRSVGLGIFIGGAVFGSLIGCVGIAILPQNKGTGIGLISGGGVLAVGGVVVGSVMLLKQDGAKVELVPQSIVGGPDRSPARGYGTGTALRVTF